ncbi:MAG: alpha/beta hydrolase [Nocardioidaceae bacterium]
MGAPRWAHVSLAGSAGALVLGCAAFTPSLLPRGWALQGLVDGLSASFGYATGVFLAWLGRTVTGWVPSVRLERRLWLLLAVVGLPMVGWTLWWGQRWQVEVHRLTGLPPPAGYAPGRILLLTLAMLALAVAAARGLRRLVRGVTRRLRRRLPDRVAQVLAVALVAALLLAFNNGVLVRGLVEVAGSVSGAANGRTTPGTARPLLPQRSGSPASLVSWQDLGRRGRDFVGLVPSRADLSAFAGRPARAPVRVYVGLRSAPTATARAALAVRELRRTHAFRRAVLVVATTTGTGLVDRAAIEPLEYMYAGDTAVAAMQYSYLPSWISFLVDRQRAERAGRVLFDAVHAAWAALPGGSRPKLLVTGSSLGAFGSQAAFRGLADVRRRTDGAVWAGTPNATPLHHRLVAAREPGTPEWRPVYDEGRSVRFAAVPADLRRPGGPWSRPRVVYLQNGSDPIVFWTPSLLFSRPDWLAEPRAPDVSRTMFWMPVVTFWQVTADLPFALSAPPGHGHSYRELFVNAWAAVAPPPGWSPGDTDRLRGVIRMTTRPD